MVVKPPNLANKAMDISTYRKKIGYFNQVNRFRRLNCYRQKCVEYIPLYDINKKIKGINRRNMLVLSLVVSLLIQGCFVQNERQDLWINVKYFSLSREFGHYFQENGLFFYQKTK